MTRVKICGLTNFKDALGAAEAGADALGFVFAERSRRRADVEAVASFAGDLPPLITLVGVFQDQPLSYVREIMGKCGLHVAQLHGNENARYLAELGHATLKAVSLSCDSDLEKLKGFPLARAFLLDSGSGGSGQTFDWALAAKAKTFGRVVLAGGLTPENVAEAVCRVRPWAVDTAGGVEASPGIKDMDKVMRFIHAAKTAETIGTNSWVH